MTERQRDRHTGRQADRQKVRQTDSRKHRQPARQSVNVIYISFHKFGMGIPGTSRGGRETTVEAAAQGGWEPDREAGREYGVGAG